MQLHILLYMALYFNAESGGAKIKNVHNPWGRWGRRDAGNRGTRGDEARGGTRGDAGGHREVRKIFDFCAAAFRKEVGADEEAHRQPDAISREPVLTDTWMPTWSPYNFIDSTARVLQEAYQATNASTKSSLLCGARLADLCHRGWYVPLRGDMWQRAE
jgi:hypothetical protein